jgi:hypothetical protein
MLCGLGVTYVLFPWQHFWSRCIKSELLIIFLDHASRTEEHQNEYERAKTKGLFYWDYTTSPLRDKGLLYLCKVRLQNADKKLVNMRTI